MVIKSDIRGSKSLAFEGLNFLLSRGFAADKRNRVSEGKSYGVHALALGVAQRLRGVARFGLLDERRGAFAHGGGDTFDDYHLGFCRGESKIDRTNRWVPWGKDMKGADE